MNKILIKDSVLNLKMLGVIAVSCILFFVELFINEGFLGNDWGRNTIIDVQTLLCNVFALSIYTQVVGLFPGIPYGFSLLQERNSGFLKFELLRMSAKRYIRAKIFYTGLSGALTTGIPYLILLIPVSYVGVNTTVQHHTMVLEELVWGPILYDWGGYFVIFLKGILLVLFGILWAEITLLISLSVKNKYIAFILPYILYELLFFLNWKEGILCAINPRYIIRYDMGMGYPLFLPFLCFGIYILLSILLIEFIFKRQVQNGKC